MEKCGFCKNSAVCHDPCQELLKELKALDGPPFWGPLLSEMLIERIFAEVPKSETILQKERRLRKERKARGKAMADLISYFSAITQEEGKCLKYYFIWRMFKEEELNHREIAEILNISRQRVSQIVNIIEGKA